MACNRIYIIEKKPTPAGAYDTDSLLELFAGKADYIAQMSDDERETACHAFVANLSAYLDDAAEITADNGLHLKKEARIVYAGKVLARLKSRVESLTAEDFSDIGCYLSAKMFAMPHSEILILYAGESMDLDFFMRYINREVQKIYVVDAFYYIA